jgi:TonB family protein
MAVDTRVTQEDEQNKKRGMIVSVAVHVVLLMLAVLPLLTFPDPPPGQEGILVNLGLPDVGEGSENAGPAPAVEEDPVDIPQEETAPPPPAESEPEPEPEREVITADDSEVAIQKEKDRKRKEQEAKERREREQEEARKRAKAEARRKAEEAQRQKEAEAANLKESLGGLFGDGDGKGNTGTAGNQGDPNGDPNSDILTGISTGSGTVGGGLGSRGVARTHKPQDNSQEQGMVVVKVCVDRSGKVISADFTQKGSTATSSRLKNLAISSAKRWQFAPGQVDKQCGTITYNFRAQ